MRSSDEGSVLAALEQAEMAARERRLAASNEAEDITSAARQRAQRISDGASQRVDAALDELRRTAEAVADAAIEELEARAAKGSSTRPGAGPQAVDQAVSVVVAHVLREAVAGPEHEASS